MVALILVTLTLAYAAVGGGQTEDCLETVVVSADAVETVSDGVICFQCDVGAGIVSSASYTVSGLPVGSDAGGTVEGVLVLYNSGSVFQPSAFVGCASGGSSATALVFLEEFQPPLISGNATVREGHTLVLECDASNSHPLPSVAWFSPQSLLLSGERRLVIGNISRNQAGLYSCVATDSNGATESSRVAVTVEFAPEVITSFTGVQYFPLGATLELYCWYECVPSPLSVKWYHNGTLLMTSDSISIVYDTTSTTLIRMGLTEIEGGNYECGVENLVGSGAVEITVRIQLPPSSLSDLSVVSSSAESLLLVWSIPEFTGFSSVAGFKVTATEESSGSVIRNLTVEGQVTSYNITGLQPLQAYSVNISVGNEAGLEGEPATISASTASLRLSAVEQLEVEIVSSTELYLQWMAPVTNPSTTAAVQFYVIDYKSDRGNEGSSMVSGLSHTLGGLEKGTNYTLSVAGVNEAGVGKARLTDSVQTAVDAPSHPQLFSAIPLSPFSLRLNWIAPADSGGMLFEVMKLKFYFFHLAGRPLQHYTLEVLVENNSVETQTLNALNSSAILQGLTQNTSYVLCLTAVNSARLESQKGRVTVVTLPVGQPQVPNSVQVTNVTVQTANIVWEEAGGYPDYYIIQYSQQNHSVETVQVVAPYHTITGLHPLSHYTVKVASHNYNGMSDFSQDSTFGTFGQVTVEGPTEGLSGEPLSLHCMVESIPASPSPLFVWSRDGGSLPATSIIINGMLSLPEPTPADTGVYVCFVAGVRRRHSVSIYSKPNSSTTGM
ncbi:Neogenin [Geodia barretti]|uniref:Neogenin n=1 Tax=Geodia barretti TaxID=519541 RepID=A0AA35SQ57_GEOBA|nr:Neogenin [Geodia barretti]